MSSLTRRQQEVLAYVTDYIGRQGVAPTLREIGHQLGIAVPTVHEHLTHLERKGLIKRNTPNASRGIAVACSANIDSEAATINRLRLEIAAKAKRLRRLEELCAVLTKRSREVIEENRQLREAVILGKPIQKA